MAGVTADVAMGLNGTDVGGDDSGGPVAAVLDASYTEDGWHGDGMCLEKVAAVRTGGFAGVAMASGLFAVLAG